MEIGKRIRDARTAVGLSQSGLSEETGIGLSSLSEFENDKRDPSVSQLVVIGKACRRSMEYFLVEMVPADDFVLWREKPAGNAAVIELDFAELSRRYRLLEEWCGEVVDPNLPTLGVTAEQFDFNDAAELARRVRHDLNLGNRPAFELLRALEEDCGIKIFHEDIEPEGAIACLKSDAKGYAILLNARSTREQRNLDLAHELFHLLTWDTFRSHSNVAGSQEEELANVFASHLLLPEEAVRSVVGRYTHHGALDALDIVDIARQFDVSPETMVWRIHHVYGWGDSHNENTRETVELVTSRARPNRSNEIKAPKLPERYRSLAVKALDRGELSIGRFAEMMGIGRHEAMKIAGQGEMYSAEISLTPA